MQCQRKLISWNTLCVIVFTYTTRILFNLFFVFFASGNFLECKILYFLREKISFKQAKMKRLLSSMWTYDVEIVACLDSRIFRIKEFRILFRGKFNFSKLDFLVRFRYMQSSIVLMSSNKLSGISEACSEPCQTSKMQSFTKIFNY